MRRETSSTMLRLVGRRALILAIAAVLLGAGSAHAAPLRTVDLAGEWSFTPKGAAPTTIQVPGGGWIKQGFDRVAEARYQREITVPAAAADDVTQLVLPAVNHEATLYVDERKVGTQTTSFTPQVFDISDFVRPGATHVIALDVRGREALLGDERPATPTLPGVPTGVVGSGYLVPDAGSWSEGIPQGIFGDAPHLRVLPAVHVVDAHVKPSVADRTLTVDVRLANHADERRAIEVGGQVTGGSFDYPSVPPRTVEVDPGQTAQVTLGPVEWKPGEESYWWPNVPYRAGYRAVLHDLELTAGGGGAEVASPAGLPSTRRTCASRRRFRIHLRRGLRRVRVTVDGRRARVVRRGGRPTAIVDLRGQPRRRVTVRASGVTRGGRRVRDVRRYHPCAVRRRGRVRAEAPRLEHAETIRFGFREMRQVGTTYELNGRRVNLRGDSLTGGIYDRIDHGGKGDAFHTFPGFLPPSEANGGWPKAVDNFQRLNANVVRIHQEPASEYMLDVADEMGLMVISETAVRGSESKQDFVNGRDNMLAHTRALVERDRNHASVVRWSQSNEPDANGRGEPKDFQLDLFNTIMAADGKRPISVDVTSNWYEDMPDGTFAVYQHYVNENGTIGGYTDDVHPREDRPFGRGEFIWPRMDPQAFTWFATSVQKMREKDASEIRPYTLACTFGIVIPGVRRTSYLCDNDLPPLHGEDSLPDPWSDRQVQRIQQGWHPLLVADSEYWEQHKQSDPAGNWPTPSQPSVLQGGQAATRRLVVFNDTFSRDPIDVAWELRSSGGEVLERGAFAAAVAPGTRESREITFTPPVGAGRVQLLLTASRPGQGELFRETQQTFEVLP